MLCQFQSLAPARKFLCKTQISVNGQNSLHRKLSSTLSWRRTSEHLLGNSWFESVYTVYIPQVLICFRFLILRSLNGALQVSATLSAWHQLNKCARLPASHSLPLLWWVTNTTAWTAPNVVEDAPCLQLCDFFIEYKPCIFKNTSSQFTQWTTVHCVNWNYVWNIETMVKLHELSRVRLCSLWANAF